MTVCKLRITLTGLAGILLMACFGAAFAADADTVVVEYTHIHHMLATPDPTPLLRIYGDGKVVVHYPIYMRSAGDYQLQLTGAELEELIASLEATGLMDVDVEDATVQRRLEMEQLRAGGELYHVSDTTETVIRFDLDDFRGRPLNRTIAWPNVYTDARKFPGLAAVQAIAAAEQPLRELLDRAVSGGKR